MQVCANPCGSEHSMTHHAWQGMSSMKQKPLSILVNFEVQSMWKENLRN